MAKKKNISKYFGLQDNRTVEEKVFDLVSKAYVQDVIDLLTADHVTKPNDEQTREEIETFLNEVFEGRYLIRCSELENTVEMVDNNLLGIRFVGIDEDFTIQLQCLPKQLELGFDDLFISTHIHSVNDRNSI